VRVPTSEEREPVPPKTCSRDGCDEVVNPISGALCTDHYLKALSTLKDMSREAGKGVIIGVMASPRQQLAIDRRRAEATCDAHFDTMRDGYPDRLNAGRDTFVRREADKAAKDIEERQLQQIPEADRADRRRR